MLRVVLPLLVVALDVYALADLFGSEEEDRGGLPRWLWVVIIVLLPLFGAVAWIVVKHSGRRAPGGRGGSGRPGRPGGPRRPSGPVAPDDDPDFLWQLEQERRRRERDSGSGSGSDDGTNGTTGTSS